MSFEERIDYVAASAFRFLCNEVTTQEAKAIHSRLVAGEVLKLDDYKKQPDLLAGTLGIPL